jgi:light-regulated signal transduction histidine kinase (bacteriophytochrome)
MRILIAEDDPAFRHLLEDMLVQWGYDVVVARDGNEAWRALQAADVPQIAILDWMMPEMDGLELCRKVRQEMPEPYTYIILLTSQQRDEDLVTGMEAGADDYITKPYKTSELRVRLKAGRRIIELQNELAAHAAELEGANRDLAAFSYTVANDLLKSLMAIGDYASAIRDFSCAKDDEQCKSNTKRIYDKTKHLCELIGIMLDFFRPMRIEIHREATDLSELANRTTERLRMTNPERRVTFRIAEGIMGNGDGQLLGVVLENLLDNAWKHTGACEEGVIEFGETEVEGKPAYFVRDNGIGFDMAHADKLFTPFQWLPGTEKFAGHGVGLATVERIIRRHGGKVWGEGKPGTGSTFYFTLSGGRTI